ncbi:DNA topoisomerase IV alpha subunit [Amanita muscaria]
MSEDSERPNPSASISTLNRIESLVMDFLEQLASQTESEDNASASRRKILLELVNRLKPTSTKCLTYPRKAISGSARPFAQLLRLLDLSHEAIIANEPLTKREVFYRDVSLFKSQRVVDQLLDDVTATFRLERRDMNIRASPKGLVCGEGLTIELLCGDRIDVNTMGGTLIPVMEDVKAYHVSEGIRWVLVVEKEAVFNALCHLHLVEHPTLLAQGLLITGKGYPDMATRHLVNYLANALPQSVPILALVDGDPHGLDILSVYKYGSQSLQHENDKLTANRLIALGLWTSDIQELCISLDSMLPLTLGDERKAFSMLQRTIPKKWKKELMRMVHTRRKAEIEILLSMPRGSDTSTPSGQLDLSPFLSYLLHRINSSIVRVES